MQIRNLIADLHKNKANKLDKKEGMGYKGHRGGIEMESKAYISRREVDKVLEMSASFPCVMVTGARQVGKSTMLRHIMPPEMRYVNMDDFRAARAAQNDPLGFLEAQGTPLCIDEIQLVPDLMRAIKYKVDAEGQNGMYWLTGSQRFHMMKGVSESLAGRVGVIELCSLSQQEILRDDEPDFFPTLDCMQRLNPNRRSCDINELYERIWRGGYPALYSDLNRNVDDYFDSYLQTYIERDVQALTQVGNRHAFLTLMKSAAARTGQQLIYADLAQDAGVSPNTAKQWISVLEASGIIALLRPYSTNAIKRLSKTPKLYFMDTGLCSWMCDWSSSRVLQSGAQSGAMLETWVFGQLYRALRTRHMRSKLCYFRDSNGAEVDFLLEHEHVIYPLEVKKGSSPVASDLKATRSIPVPQDWSLAPGVVLCTARDMFTLGDSQWAFPISAM